MSPPHRTLKPKVYHGIPLKRSPRCNKSGNFAFDTRRCKENLSVFEPSRADRISMGD